MRNNTIFAAVLVLQWCEGAADDLCVDSSTDSVVMQADASTELGRCASRAARVRVALKYNWSNHTIAARSMSAGG